MQNLERVRYFTSHYEAFKGLKMVPFGIFMILLSTRGLGWTWLGKEGDCTYTLPLLFVMIGLYFAASRYYDHHFGVVQSRRVEYSWLYGILLLSVFFGAVVLEVAITPPFSLIGLTIGGLLIWVGISTKRQWYLGAGIVMILFSLLSGFLGSNAPGNSFSTFGFWWNFTLGLVWVVLGLMDHWRLVKEFNTIQRGSV
jgi:hypothetical protein